MDAIRIASRALLAAVGLGLAMVASAQAPAGGPVGGVLESLLAEGQHPYVTAIDLASQRTTLENLYAARSGEFLWSSHHTVTASALAVMTELRAAENVGLRAADYDANRLTYSAMELAAARPEAEDQWALFDIGLSSALLAYVHDVHLGRIDPQMAGLNLTVEHARLDTVSLLQEISHSDDVPGVLRRIEPPFLHYALLKKALARFRELA